MASSAKDFPFSHSHSSKISTHERPKYFQGSAHKPPSAGRLQHGFRPPPHSHTSFFPHLDTCPLPDCGPQLTRPSIPSIPPDSGALAGENGEGFVHRAAWAPPFAAPLGLIGSFCFITENGPNMRKFSKLEYSKAFLQRVQGGSPWATSRLKTCCVWPTVFFLKLYGTAN